jgi:RNase H-fold protein (predicted Holliday junction resolvase)
VRVGLAVADELHISITPQKTLLFQKTDFWEKLMKILIEEKIGGIVVGVPYDYCEEYENNYEEHDMRDSIENFISELRSRIELDSRTNISIFRQDESFSSVQAVNVMLEIGKKKKKRTEKGIKDGVAAAIILQNFIEIL